MSKKQTAGKVFDSAQIEYDGPMSTSKAALSETDIENSAANRDISVIDIEALKKLLNSDNIIEDYEKYCDESAKRIAKLDYEKSMQFMRCLKDLNSEKALIELVRSSGYQKFIDKEELLKYIQLKIDMYNKLINTYIEMLDHNYKALKISTKQYNKMVSDLKSGKNVGAVADTILSKLNENKHLWERKWGADFTKFNGGKVFMNLKENIWNISGNARSLYNLSTKWDIIILCHGTDLTPGKSLTKEEQEFVNKYKSLASKYGKDKLSKKELEELKEEFSDEDKKIIEKYSKNLNKLIDRYDVNMDPYRYFGMYGFKTCLYIKDRLTGELKRGWGFAQPLETPFGTFRDVNECLRACISNGAKSIKVLSCNPGGYEIANDIKKMTDVTVNYQNYSVLIEGSSYIDDDYDVLTEAIDLKKLVSKVKGFLTKFKSNSEKVFSAMSDKFNKPVKLPFIEVKNNKPNVSSESATSKSDLMRKYNEANSSIEKQISTMQNNIDNLNKARELLLKLK